jgi:hypothetical protein
MCPAVLQEHATQLTDHPIPLWPAGQLVGATTTQPRSVCTKSPT